MENESVSSFVSKIDVSWAALLKTEFEKSYFQELIYFIDREYTMFPYSTFPTKENIFRSFNICPLDKLKVVILGQDPYPTKGYAHGLCFSHPENKRPIAKSLVNIFKELETDLQVSTDFCSDLSHWGKQGVLLLNSILTVREKKPQSHSNRGWETFTDAVIERISTTQRNIVFLLWGAYAQKKGRNIDATNHLILNSGHPSPMSANRGKWFGNKHFSQTNIYLQEKGNKIINFVGS